MESEGFTVCSAPADLRVCLLFGCGLTGSLFDALRGRRRFAPAVLFLLCDLLLLRILSKTFLPPLLQ